MVCILPKEASIIRLIRAVLLEQSDEWQLQHRCVQVEAWRSRHLNPTPTAFWKVHPERREHFLLHGQRNLHHLDGRGQTRDLNASGLCIRTSQNVTFLHARKRACARVGITWHLWTYDLRHTLATEALAAGADMEAVASSAGHQDPTMLLKVYQSTLDRQRRDVAASIPEVLGAQGGVREAPQIGLGGTSAGVIVAQ